MVDAWMVETDISDEWDFYTRANVGEVFPDPVSPLAFSYFQNENGLGGAEMGFRNAYYRIGVMEPGELPDDKCVFLGVANGYCYLNASALRMLGHRAPGMSAADIDAAFFGDAPGVPEFVVKPGFDRPDLTEKIGATFGWALTTPDLPDVLAHEKEMNALREARPDFSAMTDDELISYVFTNADLHFEKLFTEHIFISFLATLPIGIITAVCEAVGQPTATLKLLAGLGDVESAAPSMAMWELGRSAAASATLTAEFGKGHVGLDARLRSSNHSEAVEFIAAFDEFVYSYGCRGPNEWEARSPTWETDPDLALAAIDRMRLSPESSAPQPHNDERAAERVSLGASIASMLEADPEAHGQFLAALHAATVFMPGRERTKTNAIKLIHEMRVALRELGRRSVAAGHFPAVNSFGLLTRPELFDYPSNPGRYVDRLTERERLMAEYLQLQEPFLFVKSAGNVADYSRRDAVAISPVVADEVMQGVPGCPGVARGIARVITDSHDPTTLAPGDILVAPLTDPSWTPLFVPAAGVVVDVGAPLSHAIIVTRELGIPCVVSATGATKRIPDGALIEVNGDTGQVTVLELP
ncbi:MAG: phosphohistidine swiveling domain-containing protein [Acidimicrobiales bacterium]|jgi:rifampicin phosphotransferase